MKRYILPIALVLGFPFQGVAQERSSGGGYSNQQRKLRPGDATTSKKNMNRPYDYEEKQDREDEREWQSQKKAEIREREMRLRRQYGNDLIERDTNMQIEQYNRLTVQSGPSAGRGYGTTDSNISRDAGKTSAVSSEDQKAAAADKKEYEKSLTDAVKWMGNAYSDRGATSLKRVVDGQVATASTVKLDCIERGGFTPKICADAVNTIMTLKSQSITEKSLLEQAEKEQAVGLEWRKKFEEESAAVKAQCEENKKDPKAFEEKAKAELLTAGKSLQEEGEKFEAAIKSGKMTDNVSGCSDQYKILNEKANVYKKAVDQFIDYNCRNYNRNQVVSRSVLMEDILKQNNINAFDQLSYFDPKPKTLLVTKETKQLPVASVKSLLENVKITPRCGDAKIEKLEENYPSGSFAIRIGSAPREVKEVVTTYDCFASRNWNGNCDSKEVSKIIGQDRRVKVSGPVQWTNKEVFQFNRCQVSMKKVSEVVVEAAPPRDPRIGDKYLRSTLLIMDGEITSLVQEPIVHAVEKGMLDKENIVNAKPTKDESAEVRGIIACGPTISSLMGDKNDSGMTGVRVRIGEMSGGGGSPIYREPGERTFHERSEKSKTQR